MRILSKFGLFCALVFSQYAVAIPPPSQPNPITEVTPYTDKDKASVIVFFKFGCPACRIFHSALTSWGKTLPQGISFQFNPVIEPEEESLLSLQSFWVAEKIGGVTQREGFAAEAYSLTQDEKAGANRDRWFEALLAQGMQRQSIVAAWRSELTLSDIRYARQAHYRPIATPSMVICGKWMISPESANGDQDIFAQLANGLVSQCADELGLGISRK